MTIIHCTALLIGGLLPAAPPPASAPNEKLEYKAVAEPPKTVGAPTVVKGPSEPFVYENAIGTFKLSKGTTEGSAKYTWEKKENIDTLSFLDFGELTDSTGIGVPAGQKYFVWIYEAKDKDGNAWYLAFGVDALAPAPGIVGPVYGMYYAYKDPRMGGTFVRLLLPNGTTRK